MDPLEYKIFFDVCRVCMEPKGCNEEIKAELNLLVNKYLFVDVEKEEDSFPKTICKACAATLQDFHHLYLTTEKTTAVLISKITTKIKCEESFENEEAQIDVEVVIKEEETNSIQPIVLNESCFAEDDKLFVPMEINWEARKETPEQKRLRLERDKLWAAKARASESQEKREKRLRKQRELTREKRKNETPEQRRLRMEKLRQYKAVKASESRRKKEETSKQRFVKNLQSKKRSKGLHSQEKGTAELKKKENIS